MKSLRGGSNWRHSGEQRVDSLLFGMVPIVSLLIPRLGFELVVVCALDASCHDRLTASLLPCRFHLTDSCPLPFAFSLRLFDLLPAMLLRRCLLSLGRLLYCLLHLLSPALFLALRLQETRHSCALVFI